jgi:hypothetical protein
MVAWGLAAAHPEAVSPPLIFHDTNQRQWLRFPYVATHFVVGSYPGVLICRRAAVSRSRACIGSPCLRHRVHGASISIIKQVASLALLNAPHPSVLLEMLRHDRAQVSSHLGYHPSIMTGNVCDSQSVEMTVSLKYTTARSSGAPPSSCSWTRPGPRRRTRCG